MQKLTQFFITKAMEQASLKILSTADPLQTLGLNIKPEQNLLKIFLLCLNCLDLDLIFPKLKDHFQASFQVS